MSEQGHKLQTCQQSEVDRVLNIVDLARTNGINDHILNDLIITLADEVKRLREMERQRWELARSWFISSAAATRTELGLPPRVPLSNEDYF